MIDMTDIGGALRVLIAGAVALGLTKVGLDVDPETQAAIVVIAFGVVVRVLKRVKALDPAGYAEQLWAKHAGRRIAPASKTSAREMIQNGRV